MTVDKYQVMPGEHPVVPVEAPARPGFTARTITGAMGVYNGQLREHSHIQHVVGQEREGGGILSTARSNAGHPVSPDKVDENTLVTVNGLQGRVREVVALGLLVKNPDGTYSEAQPKAGPLTIAATAANAQGDGPKTPLETIPEKAVALSPDTESILSTMNEACPDETVLGVMDVVQHGEVSPHVLEQAASRMGVEPSQIQAGVERITEGFRNQANETVSVVGVDPAAMFAWAGENRAVALQEAMKTHALERSTEGYKALAREYLAELPNLPDTGLRVLAGEGITKIYKNDKEQILIDTPHGQMEWSSAMKAGLLRVNPVRPGTIRVSVAAVAAKGVPATRSWPTKWEC